MAPCLLVGDMAKGPGDCLEMTDEPSQLMMAKL